MVDANQVLDIIVSGNLNRVIAAIVVLLIAFLVARFLGNLAAKVLGELKTNKILKESFVVSLPVLSVDEETDITGALENMLGAFPAQHYSGWFGAGKKKLKAWPLKFAIHDILKCKMPEFGIIDASERGAILAGQPLEIDKQAAKLIGLEWKNVRYLRLVDESLDSLMPKEKKEGAV